ncbi:Uncharacterised protein [Pseudomonas fragi]|uniref:Uncharacterized protein n=1 Tax=Pseudomonas fragi TaxID=296 RepID=A0A449IKJ1_PSEFR|nr:Uncharacterised protein [Pseudomonas fragi]
MLINKTALVAAAVMVFGVSSAWAADSTSTQINISATVPSTAFYAQASRESPNKSSTVLKYA